MKINDISNWEAFLAVVKYENFSKASKALNIGVPQISKRVAKLEASLSIRLFHRSTRAVSLTSEGRALLPKITSIIEDLKNLEDQFTNDQELTGTIKVTCVSFLAHKFFVPTIEEFMRLHPKLKIELDLSQNFVNLIESAVDMAIRIEEPKDSELIYRKLAPNNLIFCATPTYLENNTNTIEAPMDLVNHDLLMLSVHNRCHFENSKTKVEDLAIAKKIICEDGVLLTNMALNHSGVLLRSIWDVSEDIDKGVLVQVLKDYPLKTFGHIYAVIPSKRYLAPRVRSLMDFVIFKAGKLLS